MPSCKEEQRVEDIFFMLLVFFWEQPFKNWDDTL